MGDKEVFSLSNPSPLTTSPPMVVWASERGNASHGPRIKVNTHHGLKMNLNDT
ncbi:MAG: hypothetical protein HQL51_09675 [Magnetococcales bacterium]|nr:hypothetical protein [Magnetococcales bacterium]